MPQGSGLLDQGLVIRPEIRSLGKIAKAGSVRDQLVHRCRCQHGPTPQCHFPRPCQIAPGRQQVHRREPEEIERHQQERNTFEVNFVPLGETPSGDPMNVDQQGGKPGLS